jgi:dTDP-4-dehydrorhamnose reductase
MTRDGTLELWGGVECTVNRVGERYFDQVRKSGHHDRPEDIARLAAIGFRAVRYPVLWERVAPEGPSTADWAWTDERLALLRGAGIRPVATLLHHGSGPRSTHLLDPAFPESFAAYAAAVATRYPWLQDYTPVNEPLTTARFSALYGHWYPHHRDDRSFVRAFLHELRATVLGMARIREINPCARLIQTEDAGRTYSSPRLVAQADFENHRRWLTADVLAGRVSESHPLWNWLVQCGASSTELYWFLDHPCAPDVVGLNYYLTSDRYLDERLEPYPASSLGGNGCDRYADVEAVRVSDYEGPAYGRILEDAWTRYGLPIALTEVHAGCTREDQLRWFVSAWQAASAARRRGVDVRAVTMWSLFGSFDWNSLVARDDNVYEVGTFDVRSTPPRRTALGTLAQALARGTPLDLLASQPGWWQRARRPTRFRTAVADFEDAAAPHPILIVGGTGTLGSAFTRACDVRGLRAVSVGRTQLDITSPGAIRRALVRWRPWAVINAAGYVRVDDAEATRDLCWRVNADGALHLAEGAAACQARYVTFSTDLVFDGLGETPYVESDSTRPINTYGASKRAAEERVAALASDALIVRTAAFFGSVEHHGFLTRALREVSAGRELLAADDVVVSPTYVPHLVDAVLDLLIDGAHGIWHLANHGQVSWADFAVLAARFASLDDSLVRRVSIAELGLRARRPAFSALDSERGRIMPTLELGVTEYLASPVNVWGERRSRSRMASGHR